MNKSKPYKHRMVIINANERDSCCFEIAIYLTSYGWVISYLGKLAIASYVDSYR